MWVLDMITCVTRKDEKLFVSTLDLTLALGLAEYNKFDELVVRGPPDLGVPFVHGSAIKQKHNELPDVLKTVEWYDTNVGVLYKSFWNHEVLGLAYTELVFVKYTAKLRRRVRKKLFSVGGV